MNVRTEVDGPPVSVGEATSSGHLRIVERQLEAEFSDALDPADIQRLARESLNRFDGAPVRRFVPILAIRDARRRAREDVAARSRS